jgi:hypothetical protein
MLEIIALEPRTQVSGITAVLNGENYGWKQFRSIGFEDMRDMIGLIQVK